MDEHDVTYRSAFSPLLLIGCASAATLFCLWGGLYMLGHWPSDVMAAVLGVVCVTGIPCMVWLGTLLYCYEAVLHPDGELEFRTLVHHRLTSTRAVHQVRMKTDGEGSDSFTITFEDGKASLLVNRATRELVDAILARNPSIETRGYPPQA